MKKILLPLIALFVLAACNKDKFQTKPQLKIKSTSSEIVPQNSGLRVTLEFTDKEGDVSDTLFFKKERLNRRQTTTVRDSLAFIVPDFPASTQGEFIVDLDYQAHLISALTPPRIPGTNPAQNEADTLRIKFVLKDKAGNKSDTAVLENIIVLR